MVIVFPKSLPASVGLSKIHSACRIGSILFVFLTFFVQVGCDDHKVRQKVISQSKDLAAQLTESPGETHNDNPSVEQQVYIDHSKSMQGFIGAGGSPSEFDQFISFMPVAMPGCKAFKYGQQPGSPPPLEAADITSEVQFDQQLHDRSQYTRSLIQTTSCLAAWLNRRSLFSGC